GWAVFYFTLFISWNGGQTVGKAIMAIKVVQLNNTPLTLWQAFGRQGGYSAGFATGLLGFIQIYWDPNRQAIQDKVADTLVLKI
ncbi:RDD family protein, partial [Arsukibacterium sp.]